MPWRPFLLASTSWLLSPLARRSQQPQPGVRSAGHTATRGLGDGAACRVGGKRGARRIRCWVAMRHAAERIERNAAGLCKQCHAAIGGRAGFNGLAIREQSLKLGVSKPNR
eukprot:352911-Chlamydomonas_euryale.AAC.14